MSYTVEFANLATSDLKAMGITARAVTTAVTEHLQQNNSMTGGTPIRGAGRACLLFLQQQFYIVFQVVDNVVRVVSVARESGAAIELGRQRV